MGLKYIKTFAVFDIETTGLPMLELGRTRITEVCLAAVSRDHILDAVNESILLPRVLHKLNLCVNPRKMILPDTSEITGLYNELLEKEQPFDENLCDILISFLGRLMSPVCLIAHNGNKFDFPILRAELNRCGKSLPDDILCADSLSGFREILGKPFSSNGWQATATNSYSSVLNHDSVDGTVSVKHITFELPVISSEKGTSIKVTALEDNIQQINETTPQRRTTTIESAPVQNKNPDRNHVQHDRTARKRLFPFEDAEGSSSPKSFKLVDIYPFLTRKHVADSHRAESDVLHLIECIVSTSPKFLTWSDDNAVKFNVIRRLW